MKNNRIRNNSPEDSVMKCEIGMNKIIILAVGKPVEILLICGFMNRILKKQYMELQKMVVVNV